MKIFTCINIFILIVLLSGATEAAPRIKNVTLETHTTLSVSIVPNLGTRFIFPFILDETDDYIPFTSQITNPAFTSKREPGRNSFVVTIAPQDYPQYGNLYVTVAGHLITVQLSTTNNIAASYSDINFVLGTAAREDLIQKGVSQRTKALEAEYKKKSDGLDALAESKAIALVGVLALEKPGHTRVKEQSAVDLPNGDKLTLYVDESVTYKPYTIFSFELSVSGDSQGVSILDAKLFSTDPQSKAVRALDAAKSIPKRVTPGDSVRGVITTLDSSINPKELLSMQVLTDKGKVEAKW